ncbi:heme ABC exporter ATP-binding protein CcmA [Benzoatithermus flavus]|uniref:Heme ABC exporter ATP-binding protein CcmA n=1 Tax=Benzoatithermus flavus TaxID=3108223 RepID=A0ABU8XW12_9PROT
MCFAADELACVRGGRLVFEALSFRLAPGDALVLRGPNGSGKSTLLRLLAGFLRPAAGILRWDDEPVAAASPEHRARLHFVGHADPVKPLLSVAENVRFASTVAGGAVALAQALRHFALDELATTPARFLSSGQKRRTTLARLLASPRPLWLLDEPGVGLDRANRDRLEQAIADHRAGGGICILATHGDVAVRDAYVLDFGS